MSQEDLTKILERVQNLINKAESTEHEEEAKVFMEKAQELLSKYALSEYDLKAVGSFDADTVTTVGIVIFNPHLNQKAELLAKIAKANNCKVVFGRSTRREDKNADFKPDYRTKEVPRLISTEKRSKWCRTMYVTGFSKDIDAVTLLYTSFTVQILRHVKSTKLPSYVNKRDWTSHFILGFASEIGKRLQTSNQKSRNATVEEAKVEGVDLLPVLVEREVKVQECYDAMWKGSLRTVRSGGMRSSTDGYSSGRNAGANADIGQSRIGGVAAIGRGN